MARLSPFEVSVKSSELAVRDALDSLLKSLAPLDLSTNEAGTVELVVAEVLNNIIEHAYRDHPSHGPILISCAHQTDGLHLRITDEGVKMPDRNEALGTKAPPPIDVNDLPEGGFGWFMISDLAKDIEYQRIGSENQLSMKIAVALEPSACRS